MINTRTGKLVKFIKETCSFCGRNNHKFSLSK